MELTPEAIAELQQKAAAYDEVSKDMHKYKGRIKEFEAKDKERAEANRAAEEAALLANQKAEEALKLKSQELEEARAQIAQQAKAKEMSDKKAALREHLSLSNPTYERLVDWDKVDPSDKNSIATYAEEFKSEHPGLVRSAAAGANLDSRSAAAPGAGAKQTEQELVKQMSMGDLLRAQTQRK